VASNSKKGNKGRVGGVDRKRQTYSGSSISITRVVVGQLARREEELILALKLVQAGKMQRVNDEVVLFRN
jgi:hypothetical protein